MTFIVLGLGTASLYLPSLGHEFLVYDDQQYVTENLHVRAGVTWAGIRWAFLTFYASNWHPLTWVSHIIDCQLYGLNPAGHHLSNLILHAVNTSLVFLVLLRLTHAFWRSACVAGLFGWHPLHVESVAWVAERKDVLSGCFFLLTLLAYAAYSKSKAQSPESKVGEKGARVEGRESRGAKASRRPVERSTLNAQRSTTEVGRWRLNGPVFWYALALGLFACGLMSKPMLVTLPFVLLLLDYWPLKRHGSTTALRLIIEKLPFVALSGVSCVLTLLAQKPSMVSTRGLGILERVEHAMVAYAHYIATLFVPRHLAVYYPYEKAIAPIEIAFYACALVAITILALVRLKQRPYLAIGWLWFLWTLVPVLGLVQVGEQAWADRYTYLPSIGLFLVVVWGVSDLMRRAPLARNAFLLLAAGAGVALLIATTIQLSYWKSTRTLFEHAAQVTRNNPLAATLLGSLLAKDGKYAQAEVMYREALTYAPGFPEAHFYLGHAFDQEGKIEAAITEYRSALRFTPKQQETRLFLAAALAKEGKTYEAEEHYLAVIRLNPESAVAHNNLAKLLHTEGKLDEAIKHYSIAVKLDPGLAQAHNNLGVLLLQKGQWAEGIGQLREALRLKPEDHESQLNLAQGLVEQEQWSEAAALFDKAVTQTNADASVRCSFAKTLAHLKRTREAMSQYASALLLHQDLPEALDGLSWILATDANPQNRNGAEAVKMAERACLLTGQTNLAKFKTLAAAYAESGRFAEALQTAESAADLARKSGQTELPRQCKAMAERFRKSRPWREP